MGNKNIQTIVAQTIQSPFELNKLIRSKLSEKRYLHSRGVVSFSLCLATKYGYTAYPSVVAGLLHDVAKDYSYEYLQKIIEDSSLYIDDYTLNHPGLWHAPVASWFAENKCGISNKKILTAIGNHPLGKPAMNTVELILFIADYCEPYRKLFNPAKIRHIAFHNPELAACLILNEKHRCLYNQGIEPHPQSLEAFSYYKKITGVKLS